jgi:hypothetical protein
MTLSYLSSISFLITDHFTYPLLLKPLGLLYLTSLLSSLLLLYPLL